jgi:hypothetical protein
MKLYFNFLEFIMVPLNEFNTAHWIQGIPCIPLYV